MEPTGIPSLNIGTQPSSIEESAMDESTGVTPRYRKRVRPKDGGSIVSGLEEVPSQPKRSRRSVKNNGAREISTFTESALTPSEIVWHEPELTPIGQIMLPPICVRAHCKHRVDAKALVDLVEETQFPLMVYLKESSIAGKGVFATRNFQKNELIGLYKGRLTKHALMPKAHLAHSGLYKESQSDQLYKDKYWPDIYATWYHNEGEPPCFLSGADSHILWTGISSEKGDVEFGRDGLVDGNALAYLNHKATDEANVKPMPTMSKSHAIGRRTQLTTKSGGDNNSHLVIPIVAAKGIEAGDELTFPYTHSDDIDFTSVGGDVFPFAGDYVVIAGDEVHFNELTEDFPTPVIKPCSDFDLSKFGPNAQEDIDRIVAGDKLAKKELIKKMTDNDESALALFIVLCLGYEYKRPHQAADEINRRMKYKWFINITAFRDYVYKVFSREDAGRLLGLRSSSEPVSEIHPRIASKELLTRICDQGSDVKDAEEAMIHFMQHKIYSGRSVRRREFFLEWEAIFKGKDGILQKPKDHWTKNNLFQFALDHEVFSNDAERIACTPLSYLKSHLESENEIEKAKGLKELDEYVVSTLSEENFDVVVKLAHIFSINSIPNVMEPNKRWKAVNVRDMQPVKLFYSVSNNPIEIDNLVSLWRTTGNKKNAEPREILKQKLKNKEITPEKFIALVRKHCDNLAHTYRILVSVKELSVESLNLRFIARCVYQNMSAEDSLKSKIKQLDYVARYIENKLQDNNDTVLDENEITVFKTELRNNIMNRNYTKIIHYIMKNYPCKEVFKTYLEEMFKEYLEADIKSTLSKQIKKVARKFTTIKIPKIQSDGTELGTPDQCSEDELRILLCDYSLIKKKD